MDTQPIKEVTILSYYVGIDIAKFKHDCCITTDDAVVIRTPFTFPNNDEGFQQLRDTLDQLDHSQKIKVGLEATGHYGRNLILFLTSLGYEISQLNPYLVKKYSEKTTLRRTKTDKKDSLLICRYLEFEASKSNQSLSYSFNDLKSLTRARDKYVRERSNHLVIVTNCLDRMFPEYKSFFEGKLGKCATEILLKFTTPERISKMTDTQIVKMHNLSKTISVNKLIRLKDLAKLTVGYSSKSDEILIKQSIQMIRVIDERIKEIEEEIKLIMKEIKSTIESIPGIGVISAATILGEFGDIASFSSPNKLLAYAGLEPSKNDSGEHKGQGHMVKHGSNHLRYVLMNIAISVKNNAPTFTTYYLKKRDEGKCYRVALSHVVRKLLRVIFKLVSTNEKYSLDSSK